MKKILLSILSLILVSGILGFPNQLSVSEKPTIVPTVIIDLTSATTVEPVIEQTPVPTNGPGFVLSSDIPDTHEAKEIIKTIEKSYDIAAKAAYSFDISKFPTVFINDPRFPVSPGTLETVRQLTLNPELETAGWLDYMTAYRSWTINAILLSEAVHAKAKAENRDLTDEEKKSLKDPWGRTAPARPDGSIHKKVINYLTLEINDDIATVTLIRGIYYSELKLVLVDGQWYVANERFLSVSP